MEGVSVAMKMALLLESLEMLTILLKCLYQVSEQNDKEKDTQRKIKEILHMKYNDQDNLLNAIMKSEKANLFTARCILLSIEYNVHENLDEIDGDLVKKPTTEEEEIPKGLKAFLMEQDHSDDNIRIVEKYGVVKKDFHGSNLLTLFPTLVHWMAALDDNKAIEVYLEVSNYPILISISTYQAVRDHVRPNLIALVLNCLMQQNMNVTILS